MRKDSRLTLITQGAAIAALYVVLTLLFAPVSFGPIQLRVSEMLCVLPMFTPAAVPGLFAGCIIANILGGGIIPDVVFGSLATLTGAWLAYFLRSKRWLVPLPSVAANTVAVPLILKYGYGITDTALPLMAVYICAGELVSCYILGELFAGALLKIRKYIFYQQ